MMCANKFYPITFKPVKTTAIWRQAYFLANRRDHCVCDREGQHHLIGPCHRLLSASCVPSILAFY